MRLCRHVLDSGTGCEWRSWGPQVVEVGLDCVQRRAAQTVVLCTADTQTWWQLLLLNDLNTRVGRSSQRGSTVQREWLVFFVSIEASLLLPAASCWQHVASKGCRMRSSSCPLGSELLLFRLQLWV